MDETARRVLQSLSAAGVRRVPSPGPGQRPAAVRASSPPAGAPTPHAVAGPAAAAPAARDAGAGIDAAVAPRPAADPAAVLAAVAAEVDGCTACKLCQGRNRTVPGEGAPHATIVFVGEGPGADEDRTGRPFVGRAGQLLDDIIVKGMRRPRSEVFICNVVKCRPPANRAPEPDEAAACSPFLERQLLAIAPRVICTLGASATRLLLQTDDSMGRLRGRLARWRGIDVIPTYHPAYLLRNPSAKRDTWDDIQKVMEIADRP